MALDNSAYIQYEFGNPCFDSYDYLPEASSPAGSVTSSVTSSPATSPTHDVGRQFWAQHSPVEYCSGYENYTGVPSPTYTPLMPVDTSALSIHETSYGVPKEIPGNAVYRPGQVQVIQVSKDQFCARLGKHEYPFDINEKFETLIECQTVSQIPVTATEKAYPPACTPPPRRANCGSGRNRKLPRAERLWEFILRLLLDPNYNPSHIEWVDRERGMFRLVNSRLIARMWGKRKNNHDMTYEKLSRAMRYYYHRKILQPVFGKKLVYKFGPLSTGWQLTP